MKRVFTSVESFHISQGCHFEIIAHKKLDNIFEISQPTISTDPSIAFREHVSSLDFPTYNLYYNTIFKFDIIDVVYELHFQHIYFSNQGIFYLVVW